MFQPYHFEGLSTVRAYFAPDHATLSVCVTMRGRIGGHRRNLQELSLAVLSDATGSIFLFLSIRVSDVEAIIRQAGRC
jgi:hypothetical protein